MVDEMPQTGDVAAFYFTVSMCIDKVRAAVRYHLESVVVYRSKSGQVQNLIKREPDQFHEDEPATKRHRT